jgi:diacylglycerol kinase (ATP)
VNKRTPTQQSFPQADPGVFTTGQEISIGMITNPHSGGNRKGIGEVRRFLAQNPGIHHAEVVTPGEVNGVLADFSARNIDLLIVNGGDGTVQSVLTALYGRALFPRPPVLALLRAGTASMLARDVGVGGEPYAALAKIRAWSMDTGRNRSLVHERALLRVSQDSAAGPICGMFFGAGAIPLAIDICHGSMNPNGVRGELMPGLILTRHLLAALTGNDKLLPATDMGISLDESPGRRNGYLFAMVSTLERLFLGLHPFWGREVAPLHFTALKTKPPYLLRNLPFLLYGRRTATATPENGFFSHNVREMTLDFRGRFTLDGELFEARGPLTIEAAGPARFLRV